MFVACVGFVLEQSGTARNQLYPCRLGSIFRPPDLTSLGCIMHAGACPEFFTVSHVAHWSQNLAGRPVPRVETLSQPLPCLLFAYNSCRDLTVL